MQNQLFHRLIATFVLITVSIPDITLADNNQLEIEIRNQMRCINNELQKQAMYNERAKLVEDAMQKLTYSDLVTLDGHNLNLNYDQLRILKFAKKKCESLLMNPNGPTSTRENNMRLRPHVHTYTAEKAPTTRTEHNVFNWEEINNFLKKHLYFLVKPTEQPSPRRGGSYKPKEPEIIKWPFE